MSKKAKLRKLFEHPLSRQERFMKKVLPTSNLKVKAKGSGVLHPPELTFPVVGIGSSAGGLETLEIFLKNVPPQSGIAFVIVQHLDPTHKGIMVELLQRVTDMEVVQVSDRLHIEINHVYVIPPNKDMSLLKGMLHLLDPVEPRGLRLPIDSFFRSMAFDLCQHSIGVILSGMGSDGTLGLRAIKEKGGGIFVQDPESAKFDGMPRSAINAGLADVVAPVEELPSRILAYLKHVHPFPAEELHFELSTQSALEKVLILLRAQTGHDFSMYKKNTVYRRIERRMGIHEIEKMDIYVHFLQENPHEVELLFKELLIGVTNFFRDQATWEALKKSALLPLLSSKPVDGLVRAWVCGCSTGEEAYSLAIAFREVVEQLKLAGKFRLQIFATDLDNDAIDKARQGIYPANISTDVSNQRLQRFFVEDEHHAFRISREIRETIVFASHNVIMDPPFTKLDIIICRNLLIYLEQELQKKLIPLFHYSLNAGGILFLGTAESIGSFTYLFDSLDAKARIFRKLPYGHRTEPVEFPASFTPTVHKSPEMMNRDSTLRTSEKNLQSITEQYLLQHYTSAAVLTNEKGDIIYIHGRTGKYLEPAAGKANWNVFAMAREGLRYELNMLFGNVLHKKMTLVKKGVTVGTNGGAQRVNITVELLDTPDLLRGLLLIVFIDIDCAESGLVTGGGLASGGGGNRPELIDQELREAHHEILTIREEMQTSQEELKSMNEEMQSANEELQSTNEELTTSKEEMQSLNEELQTVNHELESKVSDLSETNNDMKNLLNSTDIATLFLDDALNIRRFTNKTASIIKLIGTDIGRPITDIVTDLHYQELADDSREVLRSLVYSEKQIPANDGRWFIVKIMPYRTLENRIVGLVITFTDITTAKKLEGCLRETEERFRFLFEAMPGGALLQDGEGKILMANLEAERILGISVKAMQGKTMKELQWEAVHENGSAFLLDQYPFHLAMHSGKPVKDIIMGLLQHPGKECRWLKVSALPRFNADTAQVFQVVSTFIEISGSGHGIKSA